MGASVTLTLDVTPPMVLLGMAYRTPANRAAVPYVVDEPGVESAEVDTVPATVDPVEIVSVQPFLLAGNLAVTGIARDDLGNAQPFSALLFLGPLTGIWHGGNSLARSDRFEVG